MIILFGYRTGERSGSCRVVTVLLLNSLLSIMCNASITALVVYLTSTMHMAEGVSGLKIRGCHSHAAPSNFCSEPKDVLISIHNTFR